jgi:hypothetical protein
MLLEAKVEMQHDDDDDNNNKFTSLFIFELTQRPLYKVSVSKIRNQNTRRKKKYAYMYILCTFIHLECK